MRSCSQASERREEAERAVGLVFNVNVESSVRWSALRPSRATAGGGNIALRINRTSMPAIRTSPRAQRSASSVYRSAGQSVVHELAARPELRLIGLHVHVGSQITRPDPIRRAVQTIADFARE
jgi:diaminopimelate decarboxylase